jgi:hypothetical protein
MIEIRESNTMEERYIYRMHSDNKRRGVEVE